MGGIVAAADACPQQLYNRGGSLITTSDNGNVEEFRTTLQHMLDLGQFLFVHPNALHAVALETRFQFAQCCDVHATQRSGIDNLRALQMQVAQLLLNRIVAGSIKTR